MNSTLAKTILKIIIKLLDYIFEEIVETGEGDGDTDEVEDFLFPMEYLRITQGEDSDPSHKETLAMDFGGQDTGKDLLYAPCSLIVKRIRTGANGEIYYESKNPVRFADGTIDYARLLCLHDPEAYNLYEVGEIIPQGEYFYQEGGMGQGNPNKFANHVHIEAGKGKWEDCKHYITPCGNYSIKNPSHLYDLFLIPRDCIILEDGGYNWKLKK